MAADALVTIIIPVRNEEGNIRPLLERISKTASSLPSFSFEVLFVDDGSTDNTLKNIEQYSDGKIAVGYLLLSRNFSHQAALEAGLHHASGNIVISMDGDLQHPPEIIPKMLEEYCKGADVVQMQRSNTGSDFKGILSVMFYTFFSWISQVPVVPNAADFRLMSRRVVDEINKIQGRGKLLRALIPGVGYKQVYLPYVQEPRKSGKPKYTFFASYELAMHTIFKFSDFPANAMLASGTAIFLAGCISLVLLKAEVIPASAFSVGMILLAAIGGLVLFSAGIICWYLYFILEQVRSDPSYIVSKIVSPRR